MGLLRFLLAMCVVAEHAGPILGITPLPGQPAVRIFFAISGFYMAMVLATKYRSVALFWTNRALRLYPTYLAVIVCSWGLFFFTWAWMGREPSGQLFQKYAAMSGWQLAGLLFSDWTMIGRDVIALFDFTIKDGFTFPVQAMTGDWAGFLGAFAPAWTLGAELWFYLLVPWLVLLSTPTIALIALLSATLNLAILYTAGFHTALFFFPANLCFFVSGILVYRAMPFIKLAPRWTGFAGVIFASALLVFWNMIGAGERWYIAYFTIIPLIPLIFTATKTFAADTAIGNLSYPIYAWHWLVIQATSRVTHSTSPNLAAVATIAVAALCFLLLERPIDQRRQAAAA